jgi:hypothetical protein
MTTFSRRTLICGGLASGSKAALASNRQEIGRFRTADFDIRIVIEYHDGYTSSGLWFRDQTSSGQFCLSTKGIQSQGCTAQFRGSLAIVQYMFKPRSRGGPAIAMREHVRTVDHDARLDNRPPFDRTIELTQGMGSDIQAFGYELSRGERPIAEDRSPWYLFRQDLFLEPQHQTIFIIFWKHTLQRIRMLDLIPGEQTWPVIG